ncbi:HAD-IA family hydrolase [Pontivivens insulae]|uniref:phosphoglycolate phosphatase n=1 Tax=Pontivivens insulae TaxID=1639689 RepID=A0A2R8ACC9_9RHOB|nr:HAD-IA family hydrolase [Pontivivens insulae]RED13803.1 phosphoglycolate phosphatase [Pontivivens insulae]SPF29877.1 Phosphoglycolate phosphatase, chromosomal [Pontivivens insulae]
MRTAVFDLDGTLADTSADLIAAANACFEGRGLGKPLDPVADALTAFAGGRAMLRLGVERLGVDDVLIDEEYQTLLTHYAGCIDDQTVLYPGVEACLDRLTAQGWILAVCTNKPEGLAETLLGRLGIRDRFASMLGADTLPVRKPDPEHLFETVRRAGGDPARCVLMGDTITDRKTAANAKAPCVLVGFGPLGPDIAELAPDAILDHYDDLPALLERLLP